MFNFDKESIKNRFNCWGNQYSSLFSDILIVANESRGIVEKSKNPEDYDIQRAKELFNDAEGDDYKLLRYSDFPQNKVEKVKSARPYGLIYAMIEILAEFAQSCDNAEIQKTINEIINKAYEFWSVDISTVWGKASLGKMFYNTKHTELITSLKKLAENLVENAAPAIAPQVSKLLVSIFILTKGMRLNMERLKKFYAADWLYDWLNQPFVDFLNDIENHCHENQRKCAQRSTKGKEPEHHPEQPLEKIELGFIKEYKQIFSEWKTKVDEQYKQTSENIKKEQESSNSELQEIQEWLDEINHAPSLNEKFKMFFNHFSSVDELEQWLISSGITDDNTINSYTTSYYSYYTILYSLLHYWHGIRMDDATLLELTNKIKDKINQLNPHNKKNTPIEDDHHKTSQEIRNANVFLILEDIENDEHFDRKLDDILRQNNIIKSDTFTLEQHINACETILEVLTKLRNLIKDLTEIFPEQERDDDTLKKQAEIKIIQLFTDLIQNKMDFKIQKSSLLSLHNILEDALLYYQQQKNVLIQQQHINALDVKIAMFFADETLTLENGSRVNQKNYQECLIQLHSSRTKSSFDFAQSLEKQLEQRKRFIKNLNQIISLKLNESRGRFLSASDQKLTQLSVLFNDCFKNLFSSESPVNQAIINEIDDIISGFFANNLLQMEGGTYLNKPTYNECKILLHQQRANSAFFTQDNFENKSKRRQELIKKLEAIITSKKQEAQSKPISRSLEEIEKIEKVFYDLFPKQSNLPQVHSSPVSQPPKPQMIVKPTPSNPFLLESNEASSSSNP